MTLKGHQILNLVALSGVILFSGSIQTMAQDKDQSNSSTEIAWGLRTVTFMTSSGRVMVNMPDDVAAGDTISGTVIAEPAGESDEQRRTNTDELSGYVVEIDKAKTTGVGNMLKATIPAVLAGGMSYLILKDSNGDELARAGLPVRPSSSDTIRPAIATSKDFLLPRIGQAGRPIEVEGPFDGDLTNTRLKIGGANLLKLAESPRKIVATSPRNIVGTTRIELRERNAVAWNEFNSLRVTLTAPKTSLTRRERTTVTTRVEGLQGLSSATYPIPLWMVNLSPRIVKFDKGTGPVISHAISQSGVNSQGIHTFRTSVWGIQPGNFQIAVTLRVQGRGHYIKITKGKASTKISLGGGKWRLPKRLEATSNVLTFFQFRDIKIKHVVNDIHKPIENHPKTLTLDWGDGASQGVSLSNGKNVEASHTWAKPGMYYVSLKVEETSPHKPNLTDARILGQISVKPQQNAGGKWFDAYVHPTQAVRGKPARAFQVSGGAVKRGATVRVGKKGNAKVTVMVNVTWTLSNSATISQSYNMSFGPRSGSQTKKFLVETSHKSNLDIDRIDVHITPASEEAADSNPGNHSSSKVYRP